MSGNFGKLSGRRWVSVASEIPDYCVGSEFLKFSESTLEWVVGERRQTLPVRVDEASFEYELRSGGWVAVEYFFEGEDLLLRPRHGYLTRFSRER